MDINFKTYFDPRPKVHEPRAIIPPETPEREPTFNEAMAKLGQAFAKLIRVVSKSFALSIMNMEDQALREWKQAHPGKRFPKGKTARLRKKRRKILLEWWLDQ